MKISPFWKKWSAGRPGLMPRRGKRRSVCATVAACEARLLLSSTATTGVPVISAAELQAINPQLASIPPVPPDLLLQAQAADGALQGPFPDNQTFLLHSRPTATKVIYLDFNGHTTTGTFWNTDFNRATITTPAFDSDGNAAVFSNAELTTIQQVWQRVAEAFSAFDVDVTTEEPPSEDLRNTGSSDQRWGIRVAIGGTSQGVLGIDAGGIAYLTSFRWNTDTPTFVFSDTLSDNEKFTADAAIHEVGHTLGLEHDGRTSPVEEYYRGHGTGPTGWAPVMGVGYSRSLVQWSKGEYPNASQTEDDLSIITVSNGFNYRVDDYGSSLAGSSLMTVSAAGIVDQAGVVERNTDTDWFRFNTTGSVNLTVNPAERGAMLDIEANLYDANGALVIGSNPLDQINASIVTTVAPGTYFLRIDGVGKPASGTDFGYSDYGSIGQYFISGTIGVNSNRPPLINNQSFSIPENSPNATVVGTVAASDPDAGQTIQYEIVGGNTSNAFLLNSSTGVLTVGNTAALDFETTPTFRLNVRVTDSDITRASSTAVITVNLTDLVEDPSDPDDQITEAIEIPPGNMVSGAVSIGIDVDMYRFSVSANDRIQFDLDRATASSLDSYLRLFNASGQQLAFNDDAAAVGESLGQESYIDYTFATAGVYYIGVSGKGNQNYSATDGNNDAAGSTGGYLLMLTRTTGNRPPVVDDQVFSVNENSVNGTVVGTVQATDPDAGQTRTFSITAGNTGNAFAINSNTGQLTVATSSVLDFETTPSWSLTVRVTDSATPSLSDTATITVNLVDVVEPSDDSDDQISEAVLIGSSNVVSGQIANGFDVDLYRVNAAAGETIAFDLDRPQGSALDSYLRLFDAQGQQLAVNDDGPTPGENNSLESFLSYQFASAGSYFLGVSGYSNTSYNPLTGLDDRSGSVGQYTLRLTRTGGPPSSLSLSNDSIAENQASGTVVGNLSATGDSGRTFTFALVSGDGAADNGAFQIVGTQLQTKGSFDFEAKSSLSIRVRVTDSAGGVLERVFAIRVTNLNEAPVAYDATASGPSGSVLPGRVWGWDPESAALTYTLVQGPTQGTLMLQSNGSFTYRPIAGMTGAEQFTFRVSDGNLVSNTAVMRLTITDRLPEAYDGAAAVLSGQVLEGARVWGWDPEGKTLTYSVVTSTANGVLTLNSNGTFRYRPNAGFIGQDQFTFRVFDGTQFSAAATFVITVQNRAPEAYDGTATVTRNTSLTGGRVWGWDPEGRPLTYQLVTGPSNGQVNLSANGVFSFVPSLNFVGETSFAFRVTDGQLQSSAATMRIRVVNPVAIPAAAAAAESRFTASANGHSMIDPGSTSGRSIAASPLPTETSPSGRSTDGADATDRQDVTKNDASGWWRRFGRRRG
jgi:hypothetical protein